MLDIKINNDNKLIVDLYAFTNEKSTRRITDMRTFDNQDSSYKVSVTIEKIIKKDLNIKKIKR